MDLSHEGHETELREQDGRMWTGPGLPLGTRSSLPSELSEVTPRQV